MILVISLQILIELQLGSQNYCVSYNRDRVPAVRSGLSTTQESKYPASCTNKVVTLFLEAHQSNASLDLKVVFSNKDADDVSISLFYSINLNKFSILHSKVIADIQSSKNCQIGLLYFSGGIKNIIVRNSVLQVVQENSFITEFYAINKVVQNAKFISSRLVFQLSNVVSYATIANKIESLSITKTEIRLQLDQQLEQFINISQSKTFSTADYFKIDNFNITAKTVTTQSLKEVYVNSFVQIPLNVKLEGTKYYIFQKEEVNHTTIQIYDKQIDVSEIEVFSLFHNQNNQYNIEFNSDKFQINAGGKNTSIALIQSWQTDQNHVYDCKIQFKVNVTGSSSFLQLFSKDQQNQYHIKNTEIKCVFNSTSVQTLLVHQSTDLVSLDCVKIDSALISTDRKSAGLLFFANARIQINNSRINILFQPLYRLQESNQIGTFFISAHNNNFVISLPETDSTYANVTITFSGGYSNCPCISGDCLKPAIQNYCPTTQYYNFVNATHSMITKPSINLNGSAFEEQCLFDLNTGNEYNYNNSEFVINRSSQDVTGKALGVFCHQSLVYNVKISSVMDFTATGPSFVSNLITAAIDSVYIFNVQISSVVYIDGQVDFGGFASVIQKSTIIVQSSINGTVNGTQNVAGIAAIIEGTLRLLDSYVSGLFQSNAAHGAVFAILKAMAEINLDYCRVHIYTNDSSLYNSGNTQGKVNYFNNEQYNHLSKKYQLCDSSKPCNKPQQSVVLNTDTAALPGNRENRFCILDQDTFNNSLITFQIDTLKENTKGNSVFCAQVEFTGVSFVGEKFNMSSTHSSDYSALFVAQTAAQIQFQHCTVQLHVSSIIDPWVCNNAGVTVFAGQNSHKVVVKNCNITGKVTGMWVGGFVVNIDEEVIVQNCNVTAEIHGYNIAGYYAPNSWRKLSIFNCRYSGSINGTEHVGLIAIGKGQTFLYVDNLYIDSEQLTIDRSSLVPTYRENFGCVLKNIYTKRSDFAKSGDASGSIVATGLGFTQLTIINVTTIFLNKDTTHVTCGFGLGVTHTCKDESNAKVVGCDFKCTD